MLEDKPTIWEIGGADEKAVVSVSVRAGDRICHI